MLFNRKSLINLIAPLILEQLFIGTIGIADMLMVAPIGETAISGISLVDSVNMLFHSIFSAIAAGGGIICTQYLGKKEEKHANQAAKQLLLLSGVFSLIVMLVCCLGNQVILRRLFPAASSDVMHEAVTYFYLATVAYPCIMIFDACGAVFRGMGKSKVPLLGATFMCLFNIVLNALFIFVMKWGVLGAGLASLCAKAGGTTLILIFLARERGQINLKKFRKLSISRKIHWNILRLAVPGAAEDIIFNVGKLLVQGVVTSYGTTAIAANAVALSVADFVQMPAYAVGLGLVTVVGQCIGAEQKQQASFYAKKILTVSFVLEMILSGMTFIWAEPLTEMYHLTPETAAITSQLIRFHAIICGLTWIFAFNIPCVLRAASDVTFILVVSMFSMWTFRVGCSYLFREILNVGVLGVWIAMGMDWGFRGLLYLRRLRSGKWMEKKFI